MKNPTKTPWGLSQNPPPPGFFKVNSPPPWGMGVGTPWGPRGVWGWGPNPTQYSIKMVHEKGRESKIEKKSENNFFKVQSLPL